MDNDLYSPSSPRQEPLFPGRYPCSYCDHVAKSNFNKIIHERCHTNDKPFKCSHCDYQAASKSDVTKHAVIHSDVKRFKCDPCGYTTSFQSNLKSHVKCNKHRNRIQQLQQSSDNNNYQLDGTFLKNNVLENMQEGTFETGLQVGGPLDPSQMTEYVGEEGNILEYNNYGLHSSNRQESYNIQNVEVATVNNTYPPHLEQLKCSKCEFKTTEHRKLRVHSKTHIEYKCSDCIYKTKNKGNFDRHRVTHTTDLKGSQRANNCHLCNYCTPEKTALNRHLSIHPYAKTYPCNVCTKIYYIESLFKYHMKQYHEKKKFKCNICLYSCHNSSDLNKHKQCHGCNKAYTCNVRCDTGILCNFSSNTSVSITKHRKRDH